MSNDDFLGHKGEYYRNCSVQCCVRQLYTMIRISHIRAVVEVECWFRFSFFCRFRFAFLYVFAILFMCCLLSIIVLDVVPSVPSHCPRNGLFFVSSGT